MAVVFADHVAAVMDVAAGVAVHWIRQSLP
jgi:hypothetical protein